MEDHQRTLNGEDDPNDHIDVTTRAAISASLLSELPPTLRERVLNESFLVELPGGGTIYRDDDDPRCALVVVGLIRVVLSASDGRTVTVRYARSGELLGVPTVVSGPVPVSVVLLTDAKLLMLNTRTLQHLGRTEPAVAWMLARETSQRLIDTLAAVADNAFGSLRQRIARHLLDLASPQVDGRLIAAVTQQELAEAVGSARPAVARVVTELRALGLVAPASPGIAILDSEGLHAQTWS